MTGIHRFEVGRLLSGEPRTAERHDALNRAISLSSQSKAYRCESRIALPFSHQGLGSEIGAVVITVLEGVSPYPILFELQRISAIRKDDDQIKLQVQEHTPRDDVEHGTQVLRDDTEDLMQTVEANLSAREDPPLLCRTTMPCSQERAFRCRGDGAQATASLSISPSAGGKTQYQRGRSAGRESSRERCPIQFSPT